MAEEKQFAEVQIVYLGRLLQNDGKLYAYYIPLAAYNLLALDGKDASAIRREASPYDAKNAPSVVGGVYQVEAEVEGARLQTIRFGSLKWAGSQTEGALAATFAADDRLARAAKQAKIEEAKAAKNTSLDTMIDDLAQVYRGVSSANRQAFKIMLLERLDKAAWGK